MDQSRSDQNPNSQHQHNFHLHMHHMCNCSGCVYPTYYPAMGYRTPLAPLLPFPAAASAVSRPYMQHYQYTQFNVGGQYTVPLSHVSGSSTTSYGSNATGSGAIDIVPYAGAASKREREDSSTGEAERANDPLEGYDCGQITPPSEDLLLGETVNELNNTDNFVKFLERSCLTAEQIAYRNRNRPCFRNIQNLCIRTRSEILKPCTTISNIHSQGIPWATKDFIYAFVRLTNCWHILKGYWDNRDGSALGKIEKELTPEFRAIYVRWEKETVDLATQLTRIFYNLDTNLNSASSGANVYAANNLLPPQLNLTKSASESAIKKATASDTATTSTIASGSSSGSKNIRGVLQLPTASQTIVTETADQANQTYSTDFGAKEQEEYDSEEERTRKIYMKPGSYNVPKKGIGETVTTTGNSPRGIEFLETAQNVNKARETAGIDRYWPSQLTAPKKATSDFKLEEETEKQRHQEQILPNIELNLSTQMNMNVEEWLISSNFAEFVDLGKNSMSQQELKSFYLDSVYDTLPPLNVSPVGAEKQSPVTLLTRSKATPINNPIVQSLKIGNPRGLEARLALTNGLTNRNFQKPKCPSTISSEILRRNPNPYEMIEGGLTEAGQILVQNIVASLKGQVPLEGELDLDKILMKIKNCEYAYVNEVVRDMRYIIKLWDDMDPQSISWFTQKLDLWLSDNLGIYDFTDIKGESNELVGPLKSKVSSLFSNTEIDPFI